MSNATSFPVDPSPHGKRLELIAMPRQLREAHSQILETSKLLKQESEELSKESRQLRDNGHRLRSVLDTTFADIEMSVSFEPAVS